MGRFPLCAAALFVLATPAFAQPQPLDILRVTPSGEDVPAGRQIVIEFNRPVVPVGAMERKAEDLGITVTPALNCQWRWLNTTALSCNLDEKDAMRQATAYTLRIAPKIAAEDGATLAETKEFRFTTIRPRVESTYIETWKSPSEPNIRVTFNQPVTKESAVKSLFFEDTKTGRRILPIVSKFVDDEENPSMKNGLEARPLWIVRPSKSLSKDAKIVFGSSEGLVGFEGDEKGITQPVIKTMYTFPDFAFKGVYCSTLTGGEILLKPSETQTEEKLCNPMRPISIAFTAPVLRSQVRDNLIISPDLAGGDKSVKPWGEENRDWSRLSDDRSAPEGDFRIQIPVGLKAAQDYVFDIKNGKPGLDAKMDAFFTKGAAHNADSDLMDEFGRRLPPVTFKFATAHRNPNYELVYRDAVLEKGIDSDVPLYVNNLKSYSFDYTRLNTNGATSGKTKPVALPSVIDKQFAVPAGIRDILGGDSGAVYAQLKTTPVAPGKWDGANRLFAQVTPFQVYAKMGHYRSAVWVTDLATGAIVPDATVSVFVGKLSNLSGPRRSVASANTDSGGLAMLPGTDTLDPALELDRGYEDDSDRLFVRVGKGRDMALLPLSYDYEVQLWNVSNDVYANNVERYGHMKAWGMTAQGIYRAGDTMQYKIYVRDQDNNRLISPPAGRYTLEISDPTGKSVEKIDSLKLGEYGTYAAEFAIPKTAAVGWYSFKLTAVIGGVTREFYPLSVLVSDFSPAPFRVTTDLNGDSFTAGDTVKISSAAKLHSGGAYGDAAIRTTLSVISRGFTSQDTAAKNYVFDSFTDETGREDLYEAEKTLDDKGELESSFRLPPAKISYGRVIVESAVRDDRGKTISGTAEAAYYGVDRYVGLSQTGWVYPAGTEAVIKAIAVDPSGKPVKGVGIDVVLEKEETVTAKVKGAGNAYLADNTTTWKKVASCDLTSAREGQDCAFTPDSAGTYRATATIEDTKGRVHVSRQTLWVTGKDYVQWNDEREYALTLLPEKTDYKVGETARYLVKNPWPGVKAMVSVERYGVLDSFVTTLDGNTPVIEIPVKPDYVPGFYVSVVALSPRVDAPLPEMGQVDMGKPAFRVGYAQTNVADPYKEMVVTAKAAETVYRPRDTVKVSLDVKPRHGDPAPTDLAVAVLDESVFDLISSGRNAFDPYKGFYALDSLDVSNYSLLTRLIGRQKFEKKGANPGGDGGVDANMRNQFKFVSYWNPSVPLKDGHADIEFPAPDNLTGWRVLALAVTKDDLMGLGEATFKVNRPTEVRPVMPNQVREGDRFEAGFSVMNRTDKKRTLTVKIEASGDVKDGTPVTKTETVTLEPYKRANVLMPVETAMLPIDPAKPSGAIAFKVTASDTIDADGLEHTVPLLKSRTVQTAAAYGSTTEDKAAQTFAIPKDIYTDTGGIDVVLSPSLLAGLDGAFLYMRDYAYPCWEQKLSVALMASYYKGLKPYLDAETVWKDAESVPQNILSLASSYQAPNGGMAYFIAKDDYADPYLSAFTALGFRKLKDAGYKIPVDVEAGLKKYLLAFLRNDSAPDYYNKGMTSSVRAAILAAYAGDGVTKDDILRFRPAMKTMSLFGKAQYLNAAGTYPETKDAAKETFDAILAMSGESGGKLSFTETLSDGYDRILATPLRDNCVAMDALMSYPDQSQIKDKAAKIASFISQSRGSRDHFENTQENIFCMGALTRYAQIYEKDAPRLRVAASYDGKDFGTASFSDRKDKPVTLNRPLDRSDPGSKGELNLRREGTGRLYYATRLSYAAKSITDPVNGGMDLRREYSIKRNGDWTLLKSPVELRRGDLVRVDLYLSLPAARNFVVIDDPLPGALETVNTDLATASKNDEDDAVADMPEGAYFFSHDEWIDYGASRWSFYHRELRHDSARFYADWLEAGNYHLSYMAQAVATGTFTAPPVKAEEMYNPDTYALDTDARFDVRESR